MKTFIRDALIIICLMIFLTSLFSSSSKSSKSKSIDSELNQFEERIDSHVVIKDSELVEDVVDYSSSNNVFGKIGYFLSKVVISIVNGIIKIILFIVEKMV